MVDVECDGWGVKWWGCVFLPCTEWYLYKYYKKIILSLEMLNLEKMY